MNFLNKEQIAELDYAACCDQLRLLKATYDLERPITEHFGQVWPILDDLINMLLELEDRIYRFEDVRVPSMNPGVPIVKVKEEKPKVKPGKRPRQFRVLDVIYTDIHEAAKKTGIKVQTLKTYVSRKADRYAYID